MSSWSVIMAGEVFCIRYGLMRRMPDSRSRTKALCHPVSRRYLLPILVRSWPCFLKCSLMHSTDRDGTIDMVFPTCSRVSSAGVGSDCYINIAYNQQLKLCDSSTDSGSRKGVQTCRPPGDLCTADANFKFDLTNSPDNDVCIFHAYL